MRQSQPCMNKLLPLFVCLILPFAVMAGTLKGKVTDEKGEPLPFATVFIQGTTMGTTSNADGEYALPLGTGSYKVTCQYMGFKPEVYSANFTGNESVQHNFKLKEQSLEMKGVVVKANAEDPAYEM